MKTLHFLLIALFIILQATVSDARETVRIAAVFAKTGDSTEYHRPIWSAVRLAVTHLNEQGGINNKPIELIELDNSSSALGAQKAARQSVAAKVFAVIGAAQSSESLAMAPILQDAGIPMVSPTATHPALTRIGKYIFSMSASNEYIGSTAASYARHELGSKTAVIVTNTDDRYSSSLSGLFQEYFKAQGGTVFNEIDYLPGLSDYNEILKGVKVLAPDLVFIPGYYKDAGMIVKQAREMGIQSQIIGGDAWDDVMYSVAGESLHGAYYVRPGHRQLFKMRHQPVVKVYLDQFKDLENAAAAHAFDSVLVVANAMRHAADLDLESIRETLSETTDFMGVTGKIMFNHQGDRIMPLYVFKFENRSSILMKTVTPVIVAFVYNVSTLPRFFSRDHFEYSARYAVKQINLKGGLTGSPVALMSIDNKSTAIGSAQAARKSVEAGAMAVIGAMWSAHSLAMAPILQEARTIMISPMATHPDLTRVGDCIFRVCAKDPVQGKIMADFARRRLQAKTAVVLTNTDREYSISLSRFFRDEFKGVGGSVLWQGDFSGIAKISDKVLKKILRLNPDVIFAPTGDQEGGFLIRQARKMGIDAVFLGGDGWDNVIYKYAGKAAEGSYYVSHWHLKAPFQETPPFAERYKAAGGDLSVYGPAQALIYDAFMLFADAVNRAAALDHEKIKRALAHTVGFEGVTGKISIDAQGDPVKPAVILKLENGASSFYSVVYPYPR